MLDEFYTLLTLIPLFTSLSEVKGKGWLRKDLDSSSLLRGCSSFLGKNVNFAKP